MPKTTKHVSRRAATTVEPPATRGTETNINQAAAPVAPEAATPASAGAQVAQVPPARTASKKGATARKGAARGRKAARKSTSKTVVRKAAKPEQATAREGSKKGLILALLHRKSGATMAEIAQVSGWQKHSIRGFVSGTVSKKMGLTVESSRTEGGRNYRIITK